MDEHFTDAGNGTPQFSAPNFPEKPPFSATWREKIVAFGLYPLAFLYIAMMTVGDVGTQAFYLRLTGFTLGFVLLSEVLFHDQKTPWESWGWLGCVAVILGSKLLGRGQVWGDVYPAWFVHIFAVYWVVCRAGRLLAGESSRLLPLDGLQMFVVFPFKHFFLRLRTVWYTLTVRKAGEKNKATMVGAALAVVAALGLLMLAARQLALADASFDKLLSAAMGWLYTDFNSGFWVRLILSLPVGAYLCGLLAGTGREQPEALQSRGSAVLAVVEKLRKVPNAVWIGILCVFSVFYLAFFGLQGGYLFGAFTRTLPEGFTVAEYARQGFFALLRIMALNFALLYLVTRSSAVPVRQNRPAAVLCTVLLAESMLFAVIAASKLYLYIDCYGFTPLRLQSAWLELTLFAGCVASLYSLWTGKKTFRAWMLLGAATLALLHLY